MIECFETLRFVRIDLCERNCSSLGANKILQLEYIDEIDFAGVVSMPL